MDENDWNEMPESMKDAVREDRDLWLDTYSAAIERKEKPAKAEALANQKLEILGKVIFNGKRMDNSLVDEMMKNGW